MTKKKTTAPEYATREILKEEILASEQHLDAKIDGVEKRLDTKIETATQSMKDYTDSRFTQLDTKIDGVQKSVDEQGNKMDRYFNGIVKMIEGLTGRITDNEEHLKDHEQRIDEITTIRTMVEEHEKRIGALEAKK